MVKVIAHPTTGLVITPSTNNPEWGTFRVDSVQTSFENGIVNVQKRSAFVRGPLEVLNTLGLTAGKTLKGKIIKQESFTPFFVAGERGATRTQDPKINPSTGEVVLTEGRETFLQYVYTENLDAHDVWITKEEVLEPAGETPESTDSAQKM